MATTGGGGAKKPPEHPLIAKLKPDPGGPQETTVRLLGYVGRSNRDGYLRLYPSLDDLSQYVDVPESDIVHSEDVPESVMEHGGSSLWVRKSAELVVTHVESNRVQAQFLGGGIAETHLHDPNMPIVGTAQPLITQRTVCQICITVINRTCYAVTCNVTCLATCRLTCLGTCVVTCYRTCFGVTCGRTCQFVTCYATCRINTCNVLCIKTAVCQFDPGPFVTQGCPFGNDPFGGGGGGDPFGGGGGLGG